MAVQQYLRAFGADEEINLASVVAPRGSIFFTREQLPKIIAAARAAGAGDADQSYSVVYGARR